MSYGEHYSVLLEEVIAYLPSFEKEDIFVDGTFGGGGHCLSIAKKFPNIKVIGVDQDSDAIKNGLEKIQNNGLNDQVNLIKSNFVDAPDKINKPIKALLVDLGVSSHQFDTPERGFSFRFDADLDMRMDQKNNPLTAKEVVNNFSEEELADLIFELGEEKASRMIAANIVKQRAEKEIVTTKELEDIVFHSYPKKYRFGKIHPATKTFQALRIFVNNELGVLKESLSKYWDILEPRGRLLAITFHSLEDRIVKHGFKEIFFFDKNAAKILTKKPIVATEKEIQENSRSRSAKLRVLEKLK